jgi:putative membrane protein
MTHGAVSCIRVFLIKISFAPLRLCARKEVCEGSTFSIPFVAGNVLHVGAMSDLNDPRVFLAAERTLLAWTRTSLTLMGFGFVLERFGLFCHVLIPAQQQTIGRGISFWTGVVFVILGVIVAVSSAVQFRAIVQSLKPVEIPAGHATWVGVSANLALAIMGIIITIYLFRGLQ